MWNAERRIQGQADPPLSPQGRRQAGLLAQRLARRRISALYSSDLKRAFETALVIAGAVGVTPVAEPGLREIALGEWEGMRTDELALRYPDQWRRWTTEPDWDLIPGGEGAAAFEARAARALDAVSAGRHDGDVVVVTHGGVIQVALHRVVGRGSRGLFTFRIENCSISVIERRRGRSVISGVNDVGHLEQMSPAQQPADVA